MGEDVKWYQTRGKEVIDVLGTSYTVPLPSLIFLLHKGTLYVQAYAGDRRPTGDTELLSSGLPNIMSGTSWCSGGNRLPEMPKQRDINKINDVFFRSPFTHWGGQTEQPIDCGDMHDWFRGLSKKSRYPVRSLNKTNTTLSQWIFKITKQWG